MNNQSCVACSAALNLYSNVTGGSVCQQCPANFTANANATGCGAGWGCGWSGEACGCAYQSGLGRALAGRNATFDHAGAEASSASSANSRLGSVCTLVRPHGQRPEHLCHLSSSTDPLYCPAGSGGSSNGTCSPCLPGTVGLDLMRNQTCTACNPGLSEYSSVTGGFQCQTCTGGFPAFANATGCGASAPMPAGGCLPNRAALCDGWHAPSILWAVRQASWRP
jgi:hypothetical protein